MGFFIFNGKSSMDYGVQIEKYPVRPYPERIYDSYTVPGRSGDLVYDTKAYKNVVQSYECYFKNPGASSYEMERYLTAWLLQPKGYQVLEDSYDPEVFRKAIYAGPVEVSSFFGKYGRCTLKFNCQPQRWLKNGQYPMAVENGMQLWNEGEPAQPLIQVAGTGAGVLSIGSSIIELQEIPDSLTIDVESQNIYAGLKNRNEIATITGGFPELPHGQTGISFSGGITAVCITPRWWVL